MHGIDESAWSAFKAAFGGAVLERGDDGFDETLAKAVFNGDITRRPAVIVQPVNAADVALAVSLAREHRLDLTVRGGGHGYAGHAVSEGGFMVDLGRMASVSVDPGSRSVRCGGGAIWEQIDAATTAHGLAVTGGVISHTGVAGLTLGGGVGWLMRQAGLSCDNLLSAEVVTADGRTVTASAGENSDLFWALRGGGGNFGVVTEFEFRLREVSPMANVALFFWRLEEAREPLRFARQYVHELPATFGAMIAALSAPTAPFVPSEQHGVPGFAVLVVNWGSTDEHADAVAPLRALRPLFELVTPMPHVALQQMLNEDAPWGILAYEKSLYLDELTDEVIDALIERLPGKSGTLSFVPIFAIGGAVAAVGDMDTAFGGRRSTRWLVSIEAAVETPELLVADRAWVRETWSALRPYATDSGGYINFLADDDEDRVIASYGSEKYRRLAAIKAEWDPDNLFHHNANIRPAAAETALPEQRAVETETPTAERLPPA